jgi:hypothetical protein
MSEDDENMSGGRVIVFCVKNIETDEIVYTDWTTPSCIELANELNYGKRGKERVWKVRHFYKDLSWDDYGYDDNFFDEEDIIDEF